MVLLKSWDSGWHDEQNLANQEENKYMSISSNAIIDNALVRYNACKKIPAGTVLLNRNGTADQSPRCPNCGAWINHWHVMSQEVIPEDGCCVVCKGVDKDGNKQPIEGCHVMLTDPHDRRVFIAPLCKMCNAKHGQQLTLSRQVTLVWANSSETCGKLQNENCDNA